MSIRSMYWVENCMSHADFTNAAYDNVEDAATLLSITVDTRIRQAMKSLDAIEYQLRQVNECHDMNWFMIDALTNALGINTRYGLLQQRDLASQTLALMMIEQLDASIYEALTNVTEFNDWDTMYVAFRESVYAIKNAIQDALETVKPPLDCVMDGSRKASECYAMSQVLFSDEWNIDRRVIAVENAERMANALYKLVNTIIFDHASEL